MALTSTGKIFTWGGGGCGQLGHMDTDYMPKDEDGCIFLPVPKMVEAISTVVIVQISCGKAHSIAIPNTASYYSWGAAASGQLGHNNIEIFPYDEDGYPYHPIPKICDSMKGIKLVSSTCGDTHTLVLTEKGEVYAFGGNSFGQLGIGDNQDTDVDLDGSPYVPIPRKITFSEQAVISKIACGDQHSLAIDSKSNVYAWGSNILGQLGFEMKPKEYELEGEKSSFVSQPILIKLLQGKKVVSASAGEMHSIVLTDKGYLYSFGCGTNGQLGYNVQQMKGMGSTCHNISKTFHYSHDPKIVLVQSYPTLVSSILPRRVFKICSGGSHNICIAEKSARNLNKVIHRAYLNKEYCDFELVSEGRVFKVHKCILCCRSNMFKKLKNDKSSRYELHCSKLIASKIIDFIYLSDYRIIEDFDYSQLLQLLKQAHELEIEYLCSICETIISKITKNLLSDPSEIKGQKKKKKQAFELSSLPTAIKQFSEKVMNVMSSQTQQSCAFLSDGTMILVDKSSIDALKQNAICIDISNDKLISENHDAFNIDATYDLSSLLISNEASDIKVIVQKQMFSLHKLVLAQRSKFFKCAFEGSFKEKTSSEIEIEEVDVEEFTMFIKLIYSDVTKIETSNIGTLMRLSDRFGTEIISRRIEQSAIENLNKQNACKLLKHSHRYNYDMLKDCCLQIISDNWDEIINTKEVEDLDKEELLNIMRACLLYTSPSPRDS